MKITTKTKTLPSGDHKPVRLELTISRAQAKLLVALAQHVGGPPEKGTPRCAIDSFSRALEDIFVIDRETAGRTAEVRDKGLYFKETS